MEKFIQIPGFQLQEDPPIYVASILGSWLLKHSSPKWRIKDPSKGFQRVVKEDRAREIATAVLDQKRTFPNAIVLATNIENFDFKKNKIEVNSKAKFLVVDGQHRLWAQKFSQFDAEYACTIHCNLDEVAMARLFLEINDNQKRVPSSLRWDLVRLVRPNDDPFSIAAAELVFSLATNNNSPLYQRIDLTGEQGVIRLKQGSLAPEIRNLISKRSPIRELDFESQYELLERYTAAIRSLDSAGWRNATTAFYSARVLRVLIRLLPEIVNHKKISPMRLKVPDFKEYLIKIDQNSLSLENIRAKQGGAGMKEIYEEIRSQIFRRRH